MHFFLQWCTHLIVKGPVFTYPGWWWGNQYGQNIISPMESRITPLTCVEGYRLCHLEGFSSMEWSDSLKSRQIRPGEADILIYFTHGVHRDSNPFDGRGWTITHAYGCRAGIGRDLHFDEAEIKIKYTKGIKLFLLFAHELGYCKDPKALMFSLYSYVDFNRLWLSNDDVYDTQSLRTLIKATTCVTSLHYGTSHPWPQFECWYYHHN